VSLLPGWARWPLRLPWLPGAEAALVRPAGQAMVGAIRWATSAPRPSDGPVGGPPDGDPAEAA
jgi:hypothetical protein